MTSPPKHQTRELDLALAVEQHEGRLLNFVRSRVRDQAEAEEVVQETFAQFFESYDLNTAFEQLGSWLTRVAQNKIVDRFRRKKTQTDYIESLINEEEELFESPEADLSRAELRELILTGLELLPKEQRDVFVMHELEEKTFEQIATETGVNLNTLLSRKRYAVNFLRGYLAEVFNEYRRD